MTCPVHIILRNVYKSQSWLCVWTCLNLNLYFLNLLAGNIMRFWLCLCIIESRKWATYFCQLLPFSATIKLLTDLSQNVGEILENWSISCWCQCLGKLFSKTIQELCFNLTCFHTGTQIVKDINKIFQQGGNTTPSEDLKARCIIKNWAIFASFCHFLLIRH